MYYRGILFIEIISVLNNELRAGLLNAVDPDNEMIIY